MPLGAKTIENMCDYLLWYGKYKEQNKYHQLYIITDPDSSYWRFIELEDGTRRAINNEEKKGEKPGLSWNNRQAVAVSD